MGGGSAAVRAPHITSPLDALRAALGDGVTLVHEPGCTNRKAAPPLGSEDSEAPGHRAGPGSGLVRQPDLAGDPVHHRLPGADLVALEPPVPVVPAAGRCEPTRS